MEKVCSYCETAVKIIESYDRNPSKADEILSEHFFVSSKKNPFRRICQFIFLTVLRNKFLIERVISKICRRSPRKKLECLLKAAIAEVIISDTQTFPKVVNTWVEFCKNAFSENEAKFVNAVLRKSRSEVEDILKNGDIALKYSFPEWFVKRWTENFGAKKTEEILANSNSPSEVFFRVSPMREAQKVFEKYEEFFETTNFGGFYVLKSGNWDNVAELLQTKYFYAQDPSTSFAARKLAPKCGWKILDLCASPGGKSRIMADLVYRDFLERGLEQGELAETLIVSVDMPKRIKKLSQNMGKVDFLKSDVVECDLLKGDLAEVLGVRNLPREYDAVFIDAPCSNTGVLRRRPDARYRITEGDILRCAEIQKKLLEKYCEFVRIGGKLVFSTCSIDFEENENNKEEFLKKCGDRFKCVFANTYLPSRHSDGCGVFVFERLE